MTATEEYMVYNIWVALTIKTTLTAVCMTTKISKQMNYVVYVAVAIHVKVCIYKFIQTLTGRYNAVYFVLDSLPYHNPISGCGGGNSRITSNGFMLSYRNYSDNSNCGNVIEFSKSRLVMLNFILLDIEACINCR